VLAQEPGVLKVAVFAKRVPPVEALYQAKEEPVPDAVKVVDIPAITVADEGVTEGAGIGVLVKVAAVREPAHPFAVCSA
jgi:hypothetical protein